MKIKFLKKHLDYKKDDEIEIDNEKANYFIRHKVAVEVKELKSKEEKFKRKTK